MMLGMGMVGLQLSAFSIRYSICFYLLRSTAVHGYLVLSIARGYRDFSIHSKGAALHQDGALQIDPALVS
jgi:hypothetical protein